MKGKTKNMTPRELILKMLESACIDACCEGTTSFHVLNAFDKANQTEITDITFDPSTGVFTLEVDGNVTEETLKLGLEVKLVKHRHSN